LKIDPVVEIVKSLLDSGDGQDRWDGIRTMLKEKSRLALTAQCAYPLQKGSVLSSAKKNLG
jgi:hypothetical protein